MSQATFSPPSTLQMLPKKSNWPLSIPENTAERMAGSVGVPFLGRIPADPSVINADKAGVPCVSLHAESEAAGAFGDVVKRIMTAVADLIIDSAPDTSSCGLDVKRIGPSHCTGTKAGGHQ